MAWLILGLVLFLGMHSARVFADGMRTQFVERHGANAWKAVYSVVSLAGFVLLVQGYGLARQEPVVLWTPPTGLRHAASLLTLFAFVLLAAAYVPRNAIKARLHHPMVLSVKLWAFAHLLSNGNLADVLLFGGFLVWAVLSFRAARDRDLKQQIQYATGAMPGTIAAVAAGVVAWTVFAFWAHGALIGVRPFG